CQAEDGIRAFHVTGVQTCALPICLLTGDLDQLLPDRPFAEVVDVEAANALARETARRAVQVVVPGKGEAPCQGQPPTLTRRLQAGDCQGLLVVELGEGNRTLAEEGGDPPIRLAQALRERWEAVGAGPDGRGLPRAFRVE